MIKNETVISIDDEFLPETRSGLGTPATRAGIIEKLIKSGFIERQKKNLVPTALGMNLVAVLPDEIKSPSLTADWEQKLQLVQRGELSDSEFMAGIEALVSELVSANSAPIPAIMPVFAAMQNERNNGTGGGKQGRKIGKTIGKCPRCTSDVTEAAQGFFCSSESCKFVLWKDSRFWSAKEKTFSTQIAAALLKDGHISFFDLKSGKTGKNYAATIFLVDDGSKTDFKMEFINHALKKPANALKAD